MSEFMIFGSKEIFAIELGESKKRNKFCIRFWFANKSIGSFKNGGTLDYLINGYFKYVKNQSNLYEPIFKFMSDEDIFMDIVGLDGNEWSETERDAKFARMEKYGFSFGDIQFNQFSFVILSLKDEANVKFLIYEMDGKTKPKIHTFVIKEQTFLNAYKSFIQFAYKHDLKVFKPFIPLGFYYEDII